MSRAWFDRTTPASPVSWQPHGDRRAGARGGRDVQGPAGRRGPLGAGGDADVALGERLGASRAREAAAVVGDDEDDPSASAPRRSRIVLAWAWRAALESSSRASAEDELLLGVGEVELVDLDGARARRRGGPRSRHAR